MVMVDDPFVTLRAAELRRDLGLGEDAFCMSSRLDSALHTAAELEVEEERLNAQGEVRRYALQDRAALRNDRAQDHGAQQHGEHHHSRGRGHQDSAGAQVVDRERDT